MGGEPADELEPLAVRGGRAPLALIGGPCAIESEKHALMTAERIAAIAAGQADAGAGGNVASTDPLEVTYGSEADFTLTSDVGYAPLNDVTGDCPSGSWSAMTYTTGPVTAPCSLSFSFGQTTLSPPGSGQPGEGIGLSVTTPGANGADQWVFDPAHLPVFTPLAGAVDDHGQPIPPPPDGYQYPYGLLNFTLIQGTAGSEAKVTITYPSAIHLPAVYWKYGFASAADRLNGIRSWYRVPTDQYQINGNQLTLTLQDGQLGDDDWSANQIIQDPGILGQRVIPPIPTLTRPMLLMMSVLLLFVAGLGLRRER